MFKSVFIDLAKYIPAQIIIGIVGLISIPVFTRLFPPYAYGNYSLTMASVMVFTTLLGWLPTGIVRFYPAYERDQKTGVFYSTIIYLDIVSIIIVVFISGVILSFAKPYISSQLYSLMFVGIGVVAVRSLYDVFLSFLRSTRQVGFYSLFSSCKSIGSLIFALILIWMFKKDIKYVIWGIIISIILILPYMWKKAVGLFSDPLFHIDAKLTKEIARYGFPLIAGNLAAWILSLSDRYILQLFRGPHEVGIYSAIYTLSDRSILLIVYLLGLASGPIGMHIWEKEGEEKAKEFRSQLVRYYLLICLPAVTGLCALAQPITSVFTGQQYNEGYRIIPFITLGALFFGLQGHFQSGFLYYKKTGFITFAVLFSGVINIILNIFFIPKIGYMAAAVTTLISYIFLLILMIIFSRRYFIWKFPFKTLWKAVSASMIMGIIVYYVCVCLTYSILLNLALGVFVGICIYVSLLFLFQEFQQREKDMMKQILKRYLLDNLIPQN